MRVSTNTLYDQGTRSMLQQQSSLLKLQQQLSSGKRIMTPSDDPIGAARAHELSQSLALNTQYADNRYRAMDSLQQVDSTLGSVSSVIQSARTMAVAAGNPAFSDSERKMMAIELRGHFGHLLGLANTKDEQGNYLFSGFKGNTQPFVEQSAGVVTYEGDSVQRLIQVSGSRQLEVSETGKDVFGADGSNLFNTVEDFIGALETPGGGATLNNAVSTALQDLDVALDNVLTKRAAVGSRLQEVDALQQIGEDTAVQYQQSLSRLQDLDFAQAISDLMRQQASLEAAQKTFTRVSGLSLFNMI
ncbi:flagellar hook-associated protein 3 FlgL [Nitrosomonas eutropha]|uniref:Flagellar hook-associated protein 3 FlgL n=1 Tax=Nitrosomonas eutropha TaxID=916 RepID=A0A1I7H3M8_9PROT|nr:flagellar hook-associated protein FlgL [Nitrosomonas eutropha]SFU55317.1 flagellar hook-associated protein 3 FlgL [Nitrosomonas eutropha]